MFHKLAKTFVIVGSVPQRRPLEPSGGRRQRALQSPARCAAGLRRAVSALDVSTHVETFDLLGDLKQQLGTTRIGEQIAV